MARRRRVIGDQQAERMGVLADLMVQDKMMEAKPDINALLQ